MGLTISLFKIGWENILFPLVRQVGIPEEMAVSVIPACEEFERGQILRVGEADLKSGIGSGTVLVADFPGQADPCATERSPHLNEAAGQIPFLFLTFAPHNACAPGFENIPDVAEQLQLFFGAQPVSDYRLDRVNGNIEKAGMCFTEMAADNAESFAPFKQPDR